MYFYLFLIILLLLLIILYSIISYLIIYQPPHLRWSSTLSAPFGLYKISLFFIIFHYSFSLTHYVRSLYGRSRAYHIRLHVDGVCWLYWSIFTEAAVFRIFSNPIDVFGDTGVHTWIIGTSATVT